MIVKVAYLYMTINIVIFKTGNGRFEVTLDGVQYCDSWPDIESAKMAAEAEVDRRASRVDPRCL